MTRQEACGMAFDYGVAQVAVSQLQGAIVALDAAQEGKPPELIRRVLDAVGLDWSRIENAREHGIGEAIDAIEAEQARQPPRSHARRGLELALRAIYRLAPTILASDAAGFLNMSAANAMLKRVYRPAAIANLVYRSPLERDFEDDSP